MKGELTVGTLIAFGAYLGYVFNPTQKLISMQAPIEVALVALRRLAELKGVPSESPTHGRSSLISKVPGTVEFFDVHFRYAEGPPVLSGVSLRIEGGEKLAVVGASGSGKTTIANLLIGFYRPVSGSIRIDGRDIHSVAVDDLRALVTIIPQSPFLFSGTIEENIRIGKLDADREEIERAAIAANALSFIHRLPHRMDSRVGHRGVCLSGGERQRIIVARALLRDPKILILDEATSEVDGDSERSILEAVSRSSLERTIIVIAHHFSGISFADRIVMLSNGRIQAEGTHASLYPQNEEYRRFCDGHTGERHFMQR